jgi:3-hydroxyisobutyrate dehydrogenase
MSGRHIAILGLGAMGSRMAGRLMDAGHSLSVWNRTPGRAEVLAMRGARIMNTPAQAAAGADVVLSVVRDDAAARSVWLDENTGAMSAMARNAIAVESSTVTPVWARELHAAGTARGIAVLDAPVVGSRPQAEAGQLIFLAGGEPNTLAHIEPILLAMGSAIHRAGGPGAGAVVKLMVNALFGVQVAVLAELLAMARREDIDPARAAEIVGLTPTASPVAKAAAAGMLAQNFAPLFPIELVEKDFTYALDAAGGLDRGPMIAATLAVLERASEMGFGQEHLTALAKLYP